MFGMRIFIEIHKIYIELWDLSAFVSFYTTQHNSFIQHKPFSHFQYTHNIRTKAK